MIETTRTRPPERKSEIILETLESFVYLKWMDSSAQGQTEIIEIWAAQEDCIRRYAASRREQIKPFCQKYHGLHGALRIHAEAVKEDLSTIPLNTLWSVPYIAIKSGCGWLQKLGFDLPAKWLGLVPAQIKTGSQRKFEWLLLTELLGLPIEMGLLKSTQDSLADEFSKNPKLAPLRNDPKWSGIFSTDPKLWRKELTAYSAERSSAADLASTGATLLAGWAFLGRASLGALDMGDHFAHNIARRHASSHFFLGRKLGNLYYNYFPAEPTHEQELVATAAVLIAISVFSLIIHALMDPTHQAMGIHERKLRSFVDALEDRLITNVRTRMTAQLFKMAVPETSISTGLPACHLGVLEPKQLVTST